MESDTQQAHQKKQIRWAVIIISFFFIGLAIDYFFIHFIFHEKLKDLQKQERNHSPDDSPFTPTPEPSKIESTQDTSQGSPLEQFQNSIAHCLSDKSLVKSQTPTGLIKSLETKNPVQTTKFQLENTHIRLKDGSIRRLHLIPADESNNAALELRYFKLDKEGLPLAIELKPEEAKNPKPEFLATLKKQGTQIFHQLKEKKTLSDGTTLALNTINDKVVEFQVFNSNKTLSCRELDCHCEY